MVKEYRKRYSENFKREVVREYEAGASENSLRQKYGIRGSSTIKRWVKQYGREGYRAETVYIQTVADQQEYQALQKRVLELERALAETVLENRMLNTTLKIASESLQIDLKKSFGKQS